MITFEYLSKTDIMPLIMWLKKPENSFIDAFRWFN